MKLKLPNKVSYILDILRRHGFEAYAVGGCVRDSVLAKVPDDWDITTSAKPETVKRLFRRTVDTGLAHGTVTVLLEEDSFEVTTYRIDGTYSDGRHPDKVTFTSDLAEDLRRRDFTINAMAYNDEEGLVDLFGGMRDLQLKTIRCVGDPDERFTEDALRVMRAVRFAAQLGFTIDPDTAAAVTRHAEHLKAVSAERIRTELMKLLVSAHPEKIRTMYELGITGVILPDFDTCMETEQNSKHHMYSVGEHIIHAMCSVFSDPVLRLTMLLHDFGKPAKRVTDSYGIDHFPGHARVSAEMAERILRDLKFDNDTRKKVVNLVRWHDLRPQPEPADVRHAIYTVGADQFLNYIQVQWADNMAKSAWKLEEKLDRVRGVYEVYTKILERGDCLSLKDLAVGGEDVTALSVRGPRVGEILDTCLMQVLDVPERNTREYLLPFIAQLAAEENSGS